MYSLKVAKLLKLGEHVFPTLQISKGLLSFSVSKFRGFEVNAQRDGLTIRTLCSIQDRKFSFCPDNLWFKDCWTLFSNKLAYADTAVAYDGAAAASAGTEAA